MATRTFEIEINGISLSVDAVNSLLNRLDELEDKLNDLGGNVDLGTMRSDLQSIRTQLQGNVDEWDNISDRIEDATNSVVQLERAYDRIVNPFDEGDVTRYTQQVERLEDSVEGVADASRRVRGLDNVGDSARESTVEVDRLADSVESLVRAEDLLGNKLTINVAGMTLEFDNVNQAIGLLEDKLRQLAATGQLDSVQFREITEQLVNLRQVSNQTAAAIEDAFSGGLLSLVSGVSAITSVAAIGQGFSQLFGLDNSALDESILKFTSLSLILQGFITLQQLMNQLNTLIARGFRTLGSVAGAVTDVIAGVASKVPVWLALVNTTKKFQVMDLRQQHNDLLAIALTQPLNIAAWDDLYNSLVQIDAEALDLMQDVNGMPAIFRNLSDLIQRIKESLGEELRLGTINLDEYDLAILAVDRFTASLTEEGRQVQTLAGQLSVLDRWNQGAPGQLTLTQKAFVALGRGALVAASGIKALMRSTIILGLIQLAVEALTWAFDKLVDLFKWMAGDDTMVNRLDATKQALDATNNSLEVYTKNLLKLADTKVISNYTRLIETIKEYDKALLNVVKNQQALNLMADKTVKSLTKNFNTNNTWWTGANIKNVADFTKQFEILLKAVQAGTDRFKALEGESDAVKEKFGGNWWLEFWNNAGDARADFAAAQKAVISDIQYRINNLDLSKGEEEIKGFIDILETPMYQVSLANIEQLFPEDEYAKILNANIQLIRNYYNLIGLMQVQAEQEALKVRDLIGKNNIAAIRGRFAREREELRNNRDLELRDAADNEELKASIRAKYATLEAQLLRSQGNEVRNIQNLIDNNRIAAMQEGLKKQLAALNQQKKQEILAARDSEIKVGEQIAAINAKYDKLIFDAKKEFYTNKKKLLDDYAEYARQVEAEINTIELLLDARQISDSYKKRTEQLGFGQETIENIRKFYNDVRDLSNEEAKKLLEKNKKISEINTQDQIDRENKLYDERNAQLYQQARLGLYTLEEYDRISASEQVSHLNKIYSIMQKGNLDLIDLDNQYWETIKNNNITAINERINALNEMYSNVQPLIKTNSFGIIDYKSTRAELKKAKAEYLNVFKELATERENLERLFANKQITFIDYRAAKKDLDNLERDLEQSTKDIGLQLDLLITLTVQSITQYVSQYVNVLGDLWSTYNEILMAKIEQEQARLEEEYNMLEEAYKKQEELTKKHTDKLNDIEDELKTSRGDRRAHLIEQLNAERAAMLESLAQEQKILQEKDANLKKQDALEKKRREQEKKNSIVQATINTFTAVTNALAVQPWFVGLALSAVALALGMANVAQIKKQKYAKGGLLVGKSHKNGGIPVGMTGIEVEGNEYVVNKKSTSLNLPLIDYINSSNRRLTKDDLIRFYDSGKSNVNRSAKSKFADGGILPNINVPNYDNTIVILDDRPVVVEVVDIINSADNYRQVQTLAGLSGKTV